MPDDQTRDSHGVPDRKAKRDPVRRVTLIVLAICVLIFIWYVLADRQTPYTDQARVDGLIVPIDPRVSGYVTEMYVRLHSVVTKDEVLFQIDPRPYEMAVKTAEAEVDNAVQQMGARSARVKSATGRVGVARAQLDRAQRNFDRVEKISATDPGALSQADRDQAETGLAQSLEQVTSGRRIWRAPSSSSEPRAPIILGCGRPSPPWRRRSSILRSPPFMLPPPGSSSTSTSTSGTTPRPASPWPPSSARATCGSEPTCGRTTSPTSSLAIRPRSFSTWRWGGCSAAR